jgi:hypothetical protein
MPSCSSVLGQEREATDELSPDHLCRKIHPRHAPTPRAGPRRDRPGAGAASEHHRAGGATQSRQERRHLPPAAGRLVRPSRSRRNRRFSPADWDRVAALVREDWSPEQVAGWLHRQGCLEISHETIYRYIWVDKRQGAGSTRTCAAPGSCGASATGATTAAGAWRGSARSRHAPPRPRRGRGWGIGRRTPSSVPASRGPAY